MLLRLKWGEKKRKNKKKKKKQMKMKAPRFGAFRKMSLLGEIASVSKTVKDRWNP